MSAVTDASTSNRKKSDPPLVRSSSMRSSIDYSARSGAELQVCYVRLGVRLYVHVRAYEVITPIGSGSCCHR